MEKLYTCEQVANKYGVKTSTVWSWLRKKKLNGIQIGRLYRVRESDLVQFEKRK